MLDRKPLALALVCCWAMTVQAAPAPRSRIWTDQGGKFEIRAKWVDVVDGEVRLERPNGDITRIPLAKLSKKDQRYLQQQQQQQQQPEPQGPKTLSVGDQVEAKHFSRWQLGKVVSLDPGNQSVKVLMEGESDFAWDIELSDLRWPGTLQRPLLLDPVAEAIGELKTVRPDLRDMEQRFAEDSGKNRLAADPALPQDWGRKPKVVRLAGRTDFHQRPLDFAIGDLALVLHSPPGVGHQDRPGCVELVDLDRKKTLADGPSPPGTEKLQLAPAGERLVTFADGFAAPDVSGEIDLWEIEGAALRHQLRFAPYVMQAWPNGACVWVEWLDETHFFTLNGEGRLRLWEHQGAKAVYELLIDRGSRPVLSPGRQQLAVPSAAGIAIYAAATGEPLATLGSGNLGRSALAFSPSGQQLAAVSRGFVDVIDITSGATTRSFPCAGADGHAPLWWVDEEYLYTGNGLLIHVPLRVVAWKFETEHQLTRWANGVAWLLLEGGRDRPARLAPLLLPPHEARMGINGLDEAEMLAIGPGSSVTLDVQIDDPLLAKSVTQALAQACQEADLPVVAQSPLTLEATVKNGGSEKICYRSFQDHFGPGETLEVQQRVYTLHLRQQGITLWKRETVQGPPHHLFLPEGETVRTAVARVMQPTAASFRGRLPTYVLRPEYQEPLGSSTIRADR